MATSPKTCRARSARPSLEDSLPVRIRRRPNAPGRRRFLGREVHDLGQVGWIDAQHGRLGPRWSDAGLQHGERDARVRDAADLRVGADPGGDLVQVRRRQCARAGQHQQDVGVDDAGAEYEPDEPQAAHDSEFVARE